MRDIKFKVWDKARKEMVDDVRLNGMLNSKFKSDNLVFLQFTGLKDKNGTGLHDGDIYIQWGEVCRCDFKQVIYEEMNSLIFEGDFEIIGSIYENPELLS